MQHVLMVVLGGHARFDVGGVAFQRWLIKFARGLNPMEPPRKVILATVLLGATIGVAISVSSVGAGAIGVTALLML